MKRMGLVIVCFIILLLQYAEAETPVAARIASDGEQRAVISWDAVPGKSYLLETTTQLGQPWIIVITQPTPLVAEGNALQYSVAIESRAGFFRIAILETDPPNPDPSRLVLIPAGSFQMGDTFSEGVSNERPVHTVYVGAFFMDKYELTKALWDEVCQWATNHGYTFGNPGLGKAPDHPVHTINWYDAVKWCNARSEKDERTPAYYTDVEHTTVYRSGRIDPNNSFVKWNAGYRLPTEAEWEKAARGGLSGKRFPWGDTISHSQANYWSSSSYSSFDVSPTQGYHPAYATGDKPYTSPVGSFPPNGYKLYDMAGNVWEWCWDFYGYDYYASSPWTDPKGPSSGFYRVIRGGSCSYYAGFCRAAYRHIPWPDNGYDGIGFRSVLPPSQ